MLYRCYQFLIPRFILMNKYRYTIINVKLAEGLNVYSAHAYCAHGDTPKIGYNFRLLCWKIKEQESRKPIWQTQISKLEHERKVCDHTCQIHVYAYGDATIKIISSLLINV